jgi:hypothetical protein
MHYLRAQIARISFSTSVYPGTMWRLTEDNDREIEENLADDADTVPFPKIKDLAKASGWSHASPNIL